MQEGGPPKRFKVVECACGVPSEICDTYDLAPERQVLLFRQCGGADNCGFFEWLESPAMRPAAAAVESERNVRQKRPLEEVARFAAGCTRDALIVELIDASDPQLVSLCNQRQRRPEEFSIELQRAAFRAAGLRIESEVDLTPAGRTLALLRRVAD